MKRKALIMMMLLGTGALVTSCGTQQTASSYRTELTTEELEKGQASFVVNEDLAVDAEITEKKRYESGLESYLVENYFEGDENTTRENYLDHMTVFGKDPSYLEELCEKEVGQDLEFETVDTHIPLEEPGIGVIQKSAVQGTDSYSLVYTWNTGDEAYDYTDRIYGMTMRLDSENGNFSDIANNILGNGVEFEDVEIEGIDKEKMVSHYKGMVETLTGRTYSDEVLCIPMCQETIRRLNEAMPEEAEPYDENSEPAYRISFYAEINGFRYLPLSLTYEVKEGEKVSPMAAISEVDSIIVGLRQPSQRVYVTKEGLSSFSLLKVRGNGEVYREKSPCIDANEALKKAIAYFDKVLLT